ncbi:MAG: hypothetical protein EP350_09925 [Alphaproteobacteria bacterium]|nr:MAG: hypothetical protein EP350_09925 [Alphaproteobacteria bacterium]
MFNARLPLPLLAAGLSLGLAAAPTQAAAAPLAVTLPSAMPLAAIGAARLGCLTNPALAAPLAAPAPAPISKSAAILGGQMSALERMRLQQTGAAMDTPTKTASLAPVLPLAGNALPVAAVGFACPSLPQATTMATGINSMRTSGAFLGTERIKIGRTRFDRDWQRVSANDLSRRDVGRVLGTLPADEGDLLKRVNRWVNHEIAYRGDGRRDNWANARETLRARSGDCEDYAILKMQMLASAGIDREDMMLTLARDTLRGVDHAVLLVKTAGDWVMLDMQSDRVVPAAGNYGYKPVISFAGAQSYIHGRPYQAPQADRPFQLAMAD